MRNSCARTLCLMVGMGVLTSLGVAQPEGKAGTDDNIVKVLRTSNKAQTNSYVCGVFDFNNVNPYAVINYFASGIIREAGGIYSFVGPDNASGKVLVICPEYQLESYERMARQLDVRDLTSAPRSSYKYIALEHRSAQDAGFLDMLRSYTNSPGGGLIAGDVETNSVMIWDSHSGAEYAEAALRGGLDAPTQQVVIEVKIYEISASNDGRIGLDFEAWKNGPGRHLFSGGASGYYFRNYNPTFQNHGTQYGNSLLLDYPSEFFDFLVVKGQAKLMTQTELAAMNNTPANLFAGDAILYFEETAPGGDRQVEVKAQAVHTGVGLTILPMVGRDMVNLTIDVSVLNHLGYASDGTPRTGERRLTQEIRAADNQEVMLGGLSRTRTISEVNKVPILGSLPVLGWLFGGETQSSVNSTVVVALRPRIADSNRNYTAAHRVVAEQVAGIIPVSVPDTPVGFDQWLFDN